MNDGKVAVQQVYSIVEIKFLMKKKTIKCCTCEIYIYFSTTENEKHFDTIH